MVFKFDWKRMKVELQLKSWEREEMKEPHT